MKLYKILTKVGDEYYSPFQNYYYGTLKEFLNKEFVCDNFDISDKECSNGFYATEIQGLIYTNLSNNKVVFEVEMSDNNTKFSDYKWRWEKQTFLRELSLEEAKELVKKESNKMDWDYYNMMFPKNPLEVKSKITNKHKLLLQQWGSVWNLAWDSVGDSVWSLAWNSVRGLVWQSIQVSVRALVGESVRNLIQVSVEDSVGDSVMASIAAYISSAFPNIKKWKYIEHEEGVNPFQSCVNLWNDNIIPSFDGTTWRLHSGPKAEIIFEITKEELQNSNFETE